MGTLKKDLRLTQTHINQGYQITKDWNVQKKNSFWMPSKRKGKKNKEENILWKAHYLTSRLSHWKPLPWPLPVNGMYHCVNAELENHPIQAIKVIN